MNQSLNIKIFWKMKEKNVCVDIMLPWGFLNYLEECDNFSSDNLDAIPDLPQAPTEYWPVICEALIKKGAIPKSKLIVGNKYIGNCRNTDEAVWLGDKFEYTRYKFGVYYKETINHFEDDNGFDLFVPIKEV